MSDEIKTGDRFVTHAGLVYTVIWSDGHTVKMRADLSPKVYEATVAELLATMRRKSSE